MRKMVTITIMLLFTVNSQSQNKKIKMLSEDSILKKWLPAVINIEARNLKSASSGTAIFLKDNDKNYLLTARHVVFNDESQDTNAICDKIFLIENGTERDKNKKTYDANGNVFVNGDEWNLLMNVGAGMAYGHSYIFSSVEHDLAIIDLNDPLLGSKFVHTLLKRGYKPISITDIDSVCNVLDNEKILAIGFPDQSIVDTNPNTPILNWSSKLITIPIVAIGTTKKVNADYYFDATISIYHGFSGGPIIRNNKLIGIVHGIGNTVNKTASNRLNYYLTEHLILIKSSLIIPLFRELRP